MNKSSSSKPMPSVRELIKQGLQLAHDNDYDLAYKCFLATTLPGDAEAQYNLGRCYQYGYGVEADETEAASWFAKAATDANIETVLLLRRLGFGKKE